MIASFSVFTGTNKSLLTDALLSANSGITVNAGSIALSSSAPSAVNFYNGSLTGLGIGSGLLLTSGTTPGATNTSSGFGTDNTVSSGYYNGDADIDAVVNTVFQTQSYDATSLAFDFTVADPSATSISFDLVFGSDEYPEWVDAFVDSAIVMVNGVNYALFNHDPNHPLSVISPNLTAGYFRDNSTNSLPIEYDGVSHVLKIVAPINGGGATNHIKIAIADTGDHILDSGIFISNLSAGTIPGSGVVSVTPPGSTTDNSDTVTGSAQDEYIDLKGGDDVAYAGAGDDIIVGGAGNDTIYGGSGNDQLKGDGGNDSLDGGDGLTDTAVFLGLSAEYSLVYNSGTGKYSITDSKTGSGSDGADTLVNVELAQFSNGLFTITNGGFVSISSPPPPPTNTAGSIILSGVASVGNILTATVSDPDGVSGAISYQWQSSSDNGATWNTIGNNSNTYTVTSADTGSLIEVTAFYTDNEGIAEAPVSVPKSILDTKSGDLTVTLMQLKAPSGASNINPLTTLVADAIELGLSPNTATLAIKTVLGLPEIKFQSYDAYGVLLANPTDPQALAVEKVAVQVAILTSLSDDDTGLNLTSAIIKAAANNKTLNLANANDLASILGVDITGLTKNNYPQPLREIFDRNKSMSDSIADGGDVSVIEQEWQDLLSIQDGIASTSIADLSIHVNQAPIGAATASLAQGAENSPYLLNSADLLLGFSDPDGDALSVADLTASIGGAFTSNSANSWIFTPTTNYAGPVELTYTVLDGQGGSLAANQLFVLAPIVVPDLPTFTGTTGNDTALLNGTTGADKLVGLAGNDTYTVNHIGDIVVEALNAGTDTVKTSVNYTLADNVEKLILNGSSNLNGTGNELNNTLTGNSGNNTLAGLAGNDIIDGKTGADTMIGGLGNDTYTVDNVGDVVIENLNEGTDAVTASIDYTLGANLENLTLSGTANLNGTGNALKNKITGNTGANILNGGAGADTLAGKAGNDTFVFRFSESTVTAMDRVSDFVIGADKIDLLTQGGAAMNAPFAFTRAADSTTTNINTIVNNVFADADGATAGNQALGLNSAALVRANTSTYLIVNDGNAGFQSANDLVINLTGITGTLPDFGSIPVANFFV